MKRPHNSYEVVCKFSSQWHSRSIFLQGKNVWVQQHWAMCINFQCTVGICFLCGVWRWHLNHDGITEMEKNRCVFNQNEPYIVNSIQDIFSIPGKFSHTGNLFSIFSIRATLCLGRLPAYPTFRFSLSTTQVGLIIWVTCEPTGAYILFQPPPPSSLCIRM